LEVVVEMMLMMTMTTGVAAAVVMMIPDAMQGAVFADRLQAAPPVSHRPAARAACKSHR
jgi:hypothetical protein